MCYVLFLSGLLAAPVDTVVTGPIEVVATGFQFTEGPVWVADAGLLFSDIPADVIYRADKSVYRAPSGNSNGLACDREGRLIACEHGNRRVSRTEKDGRVTTLADRYLGRRLNSPNDAVVRSDGSIFFTDPPYGVKPDERELPFAGVYMIAPDGALRLLSVYFRSPNGLAFSLDEKKLYVGDSEDNFIEVFDVAEDGALTNACLFAKASVPDGMRMDPYGRLWVAAEDGLHVFRGDGSLSAIVPVPEPPSNCAFGDNDRRTLYITARKGLYKARCAMPDTGAGTK